MARDFDGTNDQISFTNKTSVTQATDLSFSCWVWQDNITQDHAVFDFSSVGLGIQLYFDDVGSSSGRTDTFKVSVAETGADDLSQEWSTGAGTSGAWQHIFLGVDTGSATGLQFWVNGVEDALSPVSLSAISDIGGTTNAIIFGQDQAGNRDRDGRIAEAAFWNRILNDTEIGNLASGYGPTRISNGLVFYAPMLGYGSVEEEAASGLLNGTLTGTTLAATHPAIVYETSLRYLIQGGI